MASDAATELVHRLSCMSLDERGDYTVTDPDSLLFALVKGSDSKGRYFAQPYLIRRLFWWQEDIDAETVRDLRDQLVERGDIKIEPIGHNIYDSEDHMTDIITILDQRRFQRFQRRITITAAVRAAVYELDGYRCVACGSADSLSLDHIHPWSLGGSDDFDNLQTMCRSCNSSKGARV